METTPTPVPVAPTQQSDGYGLHDVDGPVAGFAGYSFERTGDATRCGGIAVRVVRRADVVLGPDDLVFADLLGVQYPLGLDFGDESRQASLEKFQTWVEDTKARAEAAMAAYASKLEGRDPAVALPAMARSIQAMRYFASLLIRAEIPIDMRSGEFAEDNRDAFCDNLAETAEPLLVKAEKAAIVCAKKSEGLTLGWWSSVCQ